MHARVWGSFPNLPVSSLDISTHPSCLFPTTQCLPSRLLRIQMWIFFFNSSAKLLQELQRTEGAHLCVRGLCGCAPAEGLYFGSFPPVSWSASGPHEKQNKNLGVCPKTPGRSGRFLHSCNRVRARAPIRRP